MLREGCPHLKEVSVAGTGLQLYRWCWMHGTELAPEPLPDPCWPSSTHLFSCFCF